MNFIKQALQGRKILRDWLGTGGRPIPIEEAQSRADICAPCPHNFQGTWIWNFATRQAINKQMELRETMKIHLQGEEKINICNLCGCQLRLKVHVPFSHIYRHTPDPQLEQFPAHCWIRKEHLNLKSQS